MEFQQTCGFLGFDAVVRAQLPPGVYFRQLLRKVTTYFLPLFGVVPFVVEFNRIRSFFFYSSELGFFRITKGIKIVFPLRPIEIVVLVSSLMVAKRLSLWSCPNLSDICHRFSTRYSA